MTLVTLALQISVPPVLVAIMSVAARRWGPTFGGLILGLPWLTGPVLFFLGLNKGPEFLVSAAGGAVLAVWGIAGFILAFGFAAQRFGWPGSLAAAATCYAAVGLITQGIDIPLGLATALAAGILLSTYLLLPTPSASIAPPVPPSWDIPARMAATGALVTVIMVSADMLGPQRSGLIASFPVILTVIGAFTQSQHGRNGLLRVLRGVTLSLLAFTGFFATVGTLTPYNGQNIAYAAAAAVALVISGSLIVWSRRQLNSKIAAR